MSDVDKLTALANKFAASVLQQASCIKRGDATEGNKHAKSYIKAFRDITKFGNAGREALIPLLKHDDTNVRVMAAAFLLRYATNEALSVLEAAKSGGGLAGLGAAQTLKNWSDGSWALDIPSDQDAEGPIRSAPGGRGQGDVP